MENNKNRIFVILILISLTALLLPVSVYADIPASLKTYTVYGEFNSTVNAFHRLGLMMSDSNYRGLFFSIVVLSILIGGLFTIGKGILSGKSTAMAWAYLFGMIIAGVIVYSAFVKNTTSITVYDESLNKQIAVGGIPDGVAFIAGMANKIETGLIDIIWTSGDPRSYRENAGGLGFSIFTKAFEGGVDLSGTGNGGIYNNISIRRYIKDCLFFELSRVGSPLSINNIQINSDFVPLLAEAVNPAIYTVWYDEANKAGVTMTCTDAWNKLNTYFTSLTDGSVPVRAYWQERCKKILSDVSGSTGSTIEQACKDKSVALLADLTGIAMSSSQLTRQYLIASELWNVMQDVDPDMQMSTLASQSAGAHLIGMGIQANDWIPIMRSTLFTIMLGSLPFLFLLIPTPLFPRALSMIFGIFVFMTAWGVCDALAHSFAMDRAYDIFDGIQRGQIGFKSMMLMKDTSCKALATFGAARWSAMMIAGLLSSVLVKSGGTMLAHTIGGFRLGPAGAAAGIAAGTPEGWASKVNSIRHVAPTAAYANSFGFSDVATADTQKELTGIKTGLGEVDDIGHGSIKDASSKVAGANVMGKRGAIANTNQIKAAANEKFGGDVDGMLNSEKAITQGQAAGQAAQIISDGRDPLTYGGEKGQREVVKTEGGLDAFKIIGADQTREASKYQPANEQAQYLSHRYRDDVLNGKDPSKDQKLVQGLSTLSNISGGMATAQKNFTNMEFTPGDPAQAGNLARVLGVSPADTIGKTTRASVGFDMGKGTFKMARGDSTGGFVGVNENYRKNTVAFGTDEAAQKAIGSPAAQKGLYTSYSDPDGHVAFMRSQGGKDFSTTDRQITTAPDKNGYMRTQIASTSTGETLYDSGKKGREDSNVHKTTNDSRDVNKSGLEDTRGTKLSGAKGLVQSDDATAINRAKDSDLIQANGLGGSGKTGQRNAELLAMNGGKYVSNVMEEKGADIGSVSTSASAKLGWGKFGIGAEGKQTWQNRKVQNYITSGIYQDMMKAKEGAIAKGLNETQIGHAMQGAYSKNINTLTAKGFAAKPIRKITKEAVDKVNTNGAMNSVNILGPDTSSESVKPETEAQKQQEIKDGINPEWPGWRKGLAHAVGSTAAPTGTLAQGMSKTTPAIKQTTATKEPSNDTVTKGRDKPDNQKHPEAATGMGGQSATTSTKKSAPKQNRAGQLADQVVSGNKGNDGTQNNTKKGKTNSRGPTSAMTR